MRRLTRRGGVLPFLLACAAANAQLAADADPRGRLLAQKLRLVESLVDSPVRHAASAREPGMPSGTPAADRQLLQRAREALAAERYEEAGLALDDALRNAVRAAARPSPAGSRSPGGQQATYAGLLEQVATYRAALQDVDGPAAGEARAATAHIDVLREEAAALADGRRPDEAGRKLAAAYRHAVETLSRLRAGQTVVLSLDFATPADEYDYECRRFDSSELLVGIMLAEGRAGDRRALVDGFLREGRRLRSVAAARAGDGDHRSAISAMEQAAAELSRALQAMGAPAF